VRSRLALKKICMLLLTAVILLLAGIQFTMAAPRGKAAVQVQGSPHQKSADVGAASAKNDAVDRYAIGCILPLTGPHSQQGDRALEALMLATGVFDSAGKTPVKLAIEDSQSRPERLLREEKVIGILGPLGGTEAVEAAKEAQRLKVPIITLTQKEGITDVGDYVFRYSLTNLMQVMTVVKYAMEDRGLRLFAVLYPNDSYGKEMLKLFQQEVRRRGGSVRHIQSYDKAQMDFGNEIRSLVGLPPLDSDGQQAVEHPEIPERVNINFDALFIPDFHERVNRIAAQLFFHGVMGVQLLGTSGWNSPELVRQDSVYLEGAVFVDGFFLDSIRPEVNDFIDLFYAAYGREPDPTDALFYDAASIAIKLIAHGHTETRDQFREGLVKLKDYPGVAGMTSISANRNAEMEISILGVRDGRIVQLK
jgi:branched-chain amino acid transport system substrate-binding protein